MILCFDIGGSRIKAAVSRGGVVQPLGHAPTPLQDFAGFVAVLAGFQRGLMSGGEALRGVAISIAGVVDPASGRIKVANIPGLDGRVVGQDLEAALGVPVLVLNDADCFALAEARQGAGRGQRNVFGIILGTGVGGGLVIDGRLVSGPGGYAGEWGHGPVIRDPAFACGCGQVGCVDTVGGARGLERLHLHLHRAVASSVDILAGWQAGGAEVVATVALWLDLVSGPLAMVVNVVGPSVVPVGGGLANVPAVVAALDQAVRARILRPTDRPLLVAAGCLVEPGLVGAAEAGEVAFD